MINTMTFLLNTPTLIGDLGVRHEKHFALIQTKHLFTISF